MHTVKTNSVHLNTHQWTKLHHQQVGSDLRALGQTLQQSRVLQGTGEQRKSMRSWNSTMWKVALWQHTNTHTDYTDSIYESKLENNSLFNATMPHETLMTDS